MQERPRVTISDPARPARPPDVLDGDDPAPGSPRRLVLVAVVVLALLAAVSGIDELRQRRAADAEERRVQAVVQVELTQRFGGYQSGGYDGGTREAVLTRELGLRNTGPRPLVVTSAEVDGLRLVGAGVEVPPGTDRRLLLERRVPCSPDPSVVQAGGSLLLGLRTGAGAREVQLPLPPELVASGEEARRACGLVPASEAVQLFPLPGGRLVDGALEVPVQVASYGARPTRLLELLVGSGLSLELLDERGAPVPLPLELEARRPDGSALERTLRLRLRVVDCDRVDLSDPMSFDPGGAFALSSVAADDAQPLGQGASTSSLYDVAPVAELVAATCR